ncbi:MAG: tripartite tricarboxylate transporter permease [Deinococcota bacterium]|nr:tripartite tricarboxylate transporter permease [Deinococcota bacterium]
MDYLNNLLDLYSAGAGLVFAPHALLLIFIGTVIGIVFGCMPGLSSTMALALFTPLTFGFSPSEGIVFLIAIYVASVYAGAIAAILVNIPGTPSAIATGLDGYPMAQRGEAGRALGLATLASFFGGLVGVTILMLFSPLLAQVARNFGSWEYAMLAVLGLTLISYVSPGSIVKGLTGGIIGLLLASVGEEVIFAYPRFTGGIAELGGGLNMVVLMIGFFGFAEVFSQLEQGFKASVQQKVEGLWKSFGEVRSFAGTILRSSIIGTLIGILPGAGGSIAAIAAYGVAKRLSPRGADFGKGNPEGVVAGESSNNASVGGALVPMLTMGIPGDPMTAVLIGALMIHGLSPGPALFIQNRDFVSAIFLGFIVALVFMLVLGLAAARPFARLLSFPQPIVLAVVTLLCIVGSYAIQNSPFDIGVALLAGVAGYLLKKAEVHPAPIILGIVLGPLFEENLRRSLLLGDGSLLPFLTRPLSLGMILLVLTVIFGPLLGRKLKKPKPTP